MASLPVKAVQAVGKWLGDKALKTIAKPLDEMVDKNITDITTTIGSFVIRKVRGKFQRSLTFEVGVHYGDNWMEEALYGILYEYNNIKNSTQVHLTNIRKPGKPDDLYSTLGEGTHNMKYREWNILLCIQSSTIGGHGTPVRHVTIYTIITYDMNPKFVKMFEADMRRHRNALLHISPDSPTLNVYTDGHENDGLTYWEYSAPIPKRRINTIYLPREQLKRIIDTINEFFANKQFYIDHGIPWTLKILFYGPAGTGKSSLVKMIASEWNRNLFECSGGKMGKFIPNCLTDYIEGMIDPVLSISDVDKYPILINEADTNIANKDEKQSEEQLQYKQIFNKMINALDGITSGENRIIIMTTNHIEKFSETFLRPGRIDLIEEIGYVTPETFRRFFLDFYNIVLPENIELRDGPLTIAEMQRDILYYKLDSDQFLEKYLKKNKK